MRQLFEKNVGRSAHIHLPHENLTGEVKNAGSYYLELRKDKTPIFVNYAQIVYVRFEDEPVENSV